MLNMLCEQVVCLINIKAHLIQILSIQYELTLNDRILNAFYISILLSQIILCTFKICVICDIKQLT